MFQPSDFLIPIPGKNPSGTSVRYAPVYDEIETLRTVDNPSNLPEGVWQTNQKPPNWKEIEHLCEEVLQKKSKDIQVAAWLTESWLSMRHMAGLCDGLMVVRELTQKFWKTLYPLPENGDMSTRLIPYEWMDYHLPQTLLSLPIIPASPKDRTAYLLADWIDGVHFDLLSRKQSNPEEFLADQGRPLLTDMTKRLEQTPLAFYQTLQIDTQKALKLLEALNQDLNTKAGKEENVFYKLRNQLDTILNFTETWQQKCLQPTSEKPPSKAETPSAEKEIPQAPPQDQRTRESAYQELQDITDFFLKEDPQSPVPYALQQVLSWQGKTLPEVYATWAQDPQALSFLMQFLGVKKEG